MGQIRKRGAYYQIRYYRNGQRIEESTGLTKYDEARDLLKTREGDIAKGAPITARSTRLTFDDAVKDVVSDYTVNGKRSGTSSGGSDSTSRHSSAVGGLAASRSTTSGRLPRNG
jgi:hypothetical protein